MTATLTAHVARWKGKTKYEGWMKYARPYDIEKNLTPFELLSTRKAIDRFSSDRYYFISRRHNLDLNAGRDYIHDQAYIPPATTSVFDWVAVSESTHTPVVGDTTLTGEIVDANGLARALAGSSVHTAGTNITTIITTYNATGSYTAVQLAMIFTASSGGIGNNEATFSSTNLNSGDALQLTYTVTLG